MSLFVYSEYIVVPILSEWIYDRDLCSVDTAMCNHACRSKFLSMLSHCSPVNSFPLYIEEMYEWRLLRGIVLKTAKVHFMTDFKGELSPLRLLLRKTKRMAHLKVSFADKTPIVYNLGLIVDSLSVDMLNTELLSTLDLSFNELSISYVVSDDDIVYIASRCCNLKKLTVPVNVNISELLYESNIDEFECGLKNICECEKHSFIESCRLVRVSTADTATIIKGDSMYHLTKLSVTEYTDDRAVCYLSSHVDHLREFSATVYRTASDLIIGLYKAVFRRCYELESMYAGGLLLAEKELIQLFTIATRLKKFEVNGCTEFTDSVLQSIAQHCPLLEDLKLIRIPAVSTNVLKELFDNCKRLIHLQIFPGSLSKDFVNGLAVNKEIIHFTMHSRGNVDIGLGIAFKLFLSGSMAHSCSGLSTMLKQNPKLRIIILESMKKFNLGVCQTLVTHCPLLTTFYWSKCALFTAEMFQCLAQCKLLTSLSVEKVDGITDGMLEALLADKPNFTKLALPGCTGFTSQGVTSIARYCPLLRSINLSHCTIVTTDDVLALLRGCQHLHSLTVEGCSDVKIEIFALLKDRKMTYVNVRDCNIDPKSEDFQSLNFKCSRQFIRNLTGKRGEYGL